jgi:aspartate 1-decarboxylase
MVPLRHFHNGDKVIIMAEAWVEPGELADVAPVVVFVGERNQVARTERHRAIGAKNGEGG